MEGQEDKSSLLQPTEGLKKTLLERKQEKQGRGSEMESQLEVIRSQIQKEKKKKENSSGAQTHIQKLTQSKACICSFILGALVI